MHTISFMSCFGQVFGDVGINVKLPLAPYVLHFPNTGRSFHPLNTLVFFLPLLREHTLIMNSTNGPRTSHITIGVPMSSSYLSFSSTAKFIVQLLSNAALCQ